MTKPYSNKNLLISAFIGSKNLGDEAIFKSILDNLSIDRKRITALSINEEKTQKIGINTLYAKNITNIIKGIKECDVFLMGGGGIIQDQSSVLNFLYYAFQLQLAKHFKKPVIFCFVGVGPLRYGLSRFLMKKLANSISLAVVRDEKSREVLKRYMDNSQKIVAYHDPVLNYMFDESKLPQNRYKNKMPYAVVSMRRWFFTLPFLPVFITRNLYKLPMLSKKYDKFIAKLAKDLDAFLDDNKELHLVLVSLYDSEDQAVSRDLYARIKHKSRVILPKENLTEEEYLGIAADSRFIIGMRLHSLILGSCVRKPFVALRYSPKVDEFTDQLGLQDYSIHVERYDSERLSLALEKMMKDAPALEEKMATIISKYKEHNLQAFRLLRKEIDS